MMTTPFFGAHSSLRHAARIVIAFSFLLIDSSALAASASEPPTLPGLVVVSKTLWTTTAVRKVLRTFAFGSQATDAQIATWATMTPQAAIVEMLSFAEHNLKISPPDTKLASEALERRSHSLRGLGNFWASSNPVNLIPVDDRTDYARATWDSAMLTWSMAARVRGGNPFRHRVGYWETNFHLAVNHERGVSTYQVVRYYDDVMASLARGDDYDAVIATSSLSAAIAQQYGHRDNRYYDGVCYCNEDFAREFHQLGFGVLGKGDTAYHERISIKNTAAALTGMSFTSVEAPDEWEAENVVFGTDGHVPGPVPILHQSIAGPTAREKIRTLAHFEIAHAESLANLPLMIVKNFADDNISATEATALRTAWRSMTSKDLLRFLRAYAISTLFHSPQRVKQLTSLDRFMITANRFADTNLEQYADIPEMWRLYYEEEVLPFSPWHDVFGHQNGPETAGSAELFRKNYRRATDANFSDSEQDLNGRVRRKDWRATMPRGNGYLIGTTAEWLWERFVSDGLKNFGPLERAHLYALIGYGKDLAAVLHPQAPDTAVTVAELTQGRGKGWVDVVSTMRLPLDSSSPDIRKRVNDRIGAAIDFIIATPFMLAEEGR